VSGALDGLAGWQARWDVPHAAAAVIGREGVRETWGDTHRRFRLASVTKVLSSAALMLAVEEGALGLDDPAGPPGATVRHLLAHTAGYGFESDAPVLAKPGVRRIYSNRGIEEATAHLETVTGIPFDLYAREGIFEPLDMTATTFEGSTAFQAWGNIDDLCRFAAMFLSADFLSAEFSNQKLLAPETVAEMTSVQFPGLSGVLPGHGRFDPLDWGLGVERNFGVRDFGIEGNPGPGGTPRRTGTKHWSGSRVSTDTFGHFGGSGTFLWVDPRNRIAAVCLTDRDFGDWSHAEWPALCDAIVDRHGRESKD
jgi:CubicO group peptidase (beta-lactamase class C family)